MVISVDALAAVQIAMDLAGKDVIIRRDVSLDRDYYNHATGKFEDPAQAVPGETGWDESVPNGGQDYDVFEDLNGRCYCEAYKVREIDGELIKRGDQKCYLQIIAGYTPQVNDICEIASSFHRVMDFTAIEAESGTVVLWILQLRK